MCWMGEESGTVGSRLVSAGFSATSGIGSRPRLSSGFAGWPPVRGEVVMIDRECLVGPAVVVLPDVIDFLNAASVGERLVAAIVPGVAVVIADLRVTAFCDCAGVRSLLLAYRKARASNAELRLVVRSRAVLRVLELLGADQVLLVYPDLGMALAALSAPGKAVKIISVRTCAKTPRWPIARAGAVLYRAVPVLSPGGCGRSCWQAQG